MPAAHACGTRGGAEAAAKYQDRAKTKLIASVAAISTDEAVEYAKTAKELGYDAMISTVPYYYKFGMKAISEYYNTLRETVDRRCSSTISPATRAWSWISRTTTSAAC